MQQSSSQSGFVRKLLLIVVLGVVFFVILFKHFLAPPADFPVPYRLTIEPGQTLFSISDELYSAHVIRSPRLFEIFMLSIGSDKNISEGEYYFQNPANALVVALRISGKEFGITRTKVTFPEGFTNKEMADRFAANFPAFDAQAFMSLTKDKQGYLFPDTYSSFPSLTAEHAVLMLEDNFQKKTESLDGDIAKSGHTLKDIIIMASILEKEAAGEEDRATVAGILWTRLANGMPLQVDAPFAYLLGKESKDLTKEDLATKSPYNTYINKGLPPAPINNPGLAAITAAIHPVSTPYLYYLHDKNGQIHYARTYEEHKKNITTYLK